MVPVVLLATEDGDYSDNGVLTVLALNAILFGVLFVVYSVLQRNGKYDYAYAKRSSERLGPGVAGKLAVADTGVPALRPRPVGLIAWLGDVAGTTLDEVMARAGLDPAAYLLFLRNMSVAFAGIGLVCAGSLIAVNSSEDENMRRDALNDEEVLDLRGFADWTTSNIRPKSDLLWIHLAALAIVSAIIATAISVTHRAYLAMRSTYRAHRVIDLAEASARHTLMFTPVSAPAASGQGRAPTPREVAAWATGKGADAAAPHDYLGAIHDPVLLEARAEEFEASEKLANARSLRRATGEAQMTRTGPAGLCGSKVEAETLWGARLAAAQDKAQRRIAAGAPDTGVRFIVMRTQLDAARLAARHSQKPVSIQGIDYRVRLAPRPNGVAWNNLTHDNGARLTRRVLVAIFVAVLCFFWAVPLGFLSSLEQLASIPGVGSAFEKLLDLPPVLLGFLTAYLPVIAAVILNLVLRFLIVKLTQVEGHHATARSQTRAIQMFFAFTTASVILVPALIVGVLASAATVAETFEDDPTNAVLDLLAQVVAPKSGFFFAYLSQLALVATMIKLLRLGPVIVGGFKLSRAVTEEDRVAALRVAPFKYFVEYGFSLLAGALALTFAVTVPVITALGGVFFGLKYLSDKIQLVNTFPQVYSDNSTAFRSALARIGFCLALGQASGIILFISKEAYAQLVIAAVLLLATFAGLWYYTWIIAARDKAAELQDSLRAAAKAPEANKLELDLITKAYRHPGFLSVADREELLAQEFGVTKRGVIVPSDKIADVDSTSSTSSSNAASSASSASSSYDSASSSGGSRSSGLSYDDTTYSYSD
jgi:hypothetical protein